MADRTNIKLLANENFPVPAIHKLRAAGMDVIAVIAAMPSVSDRVVMAYARREQRWIVTFDRDYGDLVFREGLLPPPAILFFRQEPYPPELPADIVLALLSDPQRLEGCMVVISQQNIRRRRFPALGTG
jgi:predicted nuclease of predicted toxin-antitoxin system